MNVRNVSRSEGQWYAARLAALCALLAAGCLNTPSAAQRAKARASRRPAPIVPEDALDPAVRSPADFVEHEIGEGAVRHEEVVAYLSYLADASPHVTMTSYGRTHEGRRLIYVTITSEQNHARLDRIKADNQRLADPRRLSGDGDASRIIDSLPGIAWLAYCIHGDELSGTDAALLVAHRLAAGTDVATRQMRDDLVVHIDPLMNPDGRERYLAQMEQLAGKVANHDNQALQHRGLWSAGRTNHYLFDLNRDWLPLVHPETRGRAAALLEWNPHLLVDAHEMGSLDTYLFDPPREPFNTELSEASHRWRKRFSEDQASAFDRHGWSYYTREWYEEWYPGYTNAWANLQGTIGLLYEQASVDGAAVKQRSGRLLTYREAVHRQYVSSFANLDTLRRHRRDVIGDYHADRTWAVSPERSGTETLLIQPTADHARLDRLTALLTRQGIEYGFAEAAFEADGVTGLWGDTWPRRTFPVGTLVVRAAQPQRRLLRALLRFDPRMSQEFLIKEREDLERHAGTRVYDITAWSLPLAYGLNAYWANEADTVDTRASRELATPAPDGQARYGYLIDGASADVYRAIGRLTAESYNVRVATKPFAIAGRLYLPGTLLLRRHENDEALPSIVRELGETLAIDVAPLASALSGSGPDLGGRRFPLLAAPRVAIASQWPVSPTSFGATWHLLDERLRQRVSPVNLQSLGRMDLRRYNVLILPEVWSPAMLSGVLTDTALDRIRSWVRAGGTLIAYGETAAFLAGKAREFGRVRLRREVIDELSTYEEALERELAARDVSVDPAVIWGDEAPAAEPPANGDAKKDEAESAKAAARQRADEWQRLFRPQGAILGAALDERHFLTFGLHEGDEVHRLPVLVSGSYALMAKHPVAVPARLLGPDEIRLAGLMWPEARERWGGTAYATAERMGRGQVILFVTDPFFRGFFEGSGRMLLNAVFLGPGAGASQPVPW